MHRRRLIILALLFSGPCVVSGNKLMPDRMALGVTVDADTNQIRTYNGTLQWSLR